MSQQPSSPQSIHIDDYDYPLPDERIARHPLSQRDACRLLVRAADGTLSDCRFSDIPGLLPEDAVMVMNDTRVINARLHMRKPTGAHIEIFCLEPASPADYALSFATTEECDWTCLVGNSKRWQDGVVEASTVVDGIEVTLTAERLSKGADSSSVIRFRWNGGVTFSQVIEALGQIPIPPYLNRESESTDASDYQTVYSRIEGSVAAPTAGLHFTPELLATLDEKGIQRLGVTLHVGAGTFRPVKSDLIGEHPMHSETIIVRRSTLEGLKKAMLESRPIVAVGTTSVRTLESLYQSGCQISDGTFDGVVPQWYPYSEEHPQLTPLEAVQSVLENMGDDDVFTFATRLMIAPGYQYRIVKGIVTNFHQPRSTLLLLVSAFIGDDWRRMYAHALENPDYRFLSYGDACLLLS